MIRRSFQVRAWTSFGALRILKRGVGIGKVSNYIGSGFSMVVVGYATPKRLGWSKNWSIEVIYEKRK